jgi:phenylpyruvate tautomerase
MAAPEKYVLVNIKYNPFLTFGGSCDPAFLLTIVSRYRLDAWSCTNHSTSAQLKLGDSNPEANIKYSAALFSFFEQKLGVPGDRGYITFNNVGGSCIG